MNQGLLNNPQRDIRKARRRRAGELNLVSMIDVLTVLVFFLLVNQLGVSVLGVNLPGPSKSAAVNKGQELSVLVQKDRLTLQNHSVPVAVFRQKNGAYDIDGLVGKLETMKKAEPSNKRISILMAPDVSYEALITMMDAVRTTPASKTSSDGDFYPDIAVGAASRSAANVTDNRPISKGGNDGHPA